MKSRRRPLSAQELRQLFDSDVIFIRNPSDLGARKAVLRDPDAARAALRRGHLAVRRLLCRALLEALLGVPPVRELDYDDAETEPVALPRPLERAFPIAAHAPPCDRSETIGRSGRVAA